LEQILVDIDAIFNDETAQKFEDKEFYTACTSSTQRIKNRQVRRTYLESRIS
jgi:hypothetical protein